MDDVLAAASAIAPLGLPLSDQLLLCMAPVDTAQPASLAALVSFARALATHGTVGLGVAGSACPNLARLPRTQGELAQCEEGAQVCDLYIWLATRMPEAFHELELAQTMREAAGVAIMEGLRVLARPPPSKAAAKASAKAGQHAFDAAQQAVALALAAAGGGAGGRRTGALAWHLAAGGGRVHQSVGFPPVPVGFRVPKTQGLRSRGAKRGGGDVATWL